MEFLIKYRRQILAIIGLLTVFWAIGLTRLSINFSFDSFFPKDDPYFQFYENFQTTFAEVEDNIVNIALKSPEEDVFDRRFLTRADSLFEVLAALPGVDSSISATSLRLPRRRGLGVSDAPYLDFRSQARLERSKEDILEDSLLVGGFLTRSLDHVVGLYVFSADIIDKKARDHLNNEFVKILDASGLEYKISGTPFIRTAYVKKIREEMLFFLTASISLIILVLYLTYRSRWGVVVPLLAVILALVWTMGLMGWMGRSVNMLSNLLIPMIFVVGMSDVIHLTTKYLQELRLGRLRMVAVKFTLKEIGLAIFLTSITTAVGFASLTISKVEPIREFGLFAAVSVIFAYVISVAIIPNVLPFLKAEKLLNAPSLDNSPVWSRFLTRLYSWSRSNQVGILVGTTLLLAVSGFFLGRIPLDTHLIEDLGPNDPVRKTMEFFEKEATGLRPFELVLELKDDRKATDLEVLQEVEKIQEYLDGQGRFGQFLSPASIIKQANYVYHFQRDRFRALPETQEEVDEILDFAVANGQDQILNRVMTLDEKRLRISSRLPDIGTYAYDDIKAGLLEFVAQNGHPEWYTLTDTGKAVLTDHNLSYLRRSLLLGLSLAFAVIGLIMGLLFRSLRILVISLIPNIIPLILTGGVMGLAKISLSTSTAIVFVVAFGIAVDNTIHFLSRFRLELRAGNDLDTAIANTMAGTGKALIVTSIVLVAGFFLLLFSTFKGVYNIGLFIALTVTFALFSNLVLLPVLLRILGRKEKVLAGS